MTVDPFVATLHEWIEVSTRRSMRDFLRYARQSKLSMSNLGAIFYIHRFGTCGVKEIGEHLGVTSAAVSQMLDRLVEQGLIGRSEDAEDRRVKRIELTERGQEVFEQGLKARGSWIDFVADQLSQEEKETISSSLGILISKVRQLDQAAVPSN